MSELFNWARNTRRNYGKYRFLIESPVDLPNLMVRKVDSELERLYRRSDYKAKIAFQLPQELHFIPLFENVLFDKLINIHNARSTKKKFVHPGTFMLLDNHINEYIPLSTGAKLPMERYSEHEAKHWFELEADNQHKKGPNIALLQLYWGTVPNTQIKALMYEAYTLSTVHYRSRIMEMLMAPNYPSEADFKKLEIASSKMHNFQKALNKIRALIITKYKAYQQGLFLLKTPVELEEALLSIYWEWREKNSSRINMEVY